MEIGSVVETIVDKITTECLEKIKIPKGTVGVVCEINADYASVEIWGDGAPEGIEGVFDFNFDEIREIRTFSSFSRPSSK